ncbi:methionyl-tRNA formyltransferase [Bifidobacterium gallicum]|uniref:Methionyl-tRNA formyltransferase n=1 Tax=Bifidobacterium gallicum DSM 20093 = LMG 11596 TaxID=561180 RepID=D1NU99_9BIFI|nr:methionyl-tRNA formyltransferase [Bifidobacterium gallicum]EFA23303.1 methionyl-tRNA formyltransferase [Bifidobacterium gallicum DSM 20093 = LMG 11596]KFI58945.1 methionyl-tRNA formyltransferase [Bifidobacterium gallicum DSM 20093 = LMG 11596]
MLKVLFAGTPETAVPSLRKLAHDTDHFEIVAVLTRPDAPTGRGRKLQPSAVKQAALELGLPVIESDPKEETFVDELAATGAQIGVVVAYGNILRQHVLDALPMGWVNLHFSLLPEWRGAAPVQRAIWAGDSVTGTTVFQLTRGMDEGPVLAQSTMEIRAHDTSGELLERLAQDGSHLLAAALEALAEGRISPVPQPQGSFEVARKITTEDAAVRFKAPVFAVDRQIRACTPAPGAWAHLHANAVAEDADAVEGKEAPAATVLHILKAVPADTEDMQVPDDLEPGKLVVTKKHVWVGTLTSPLELLAVKPQGKKAMAAADWARGAHLDETAYLD